jgi:site-specific DNA-methyltransferase (adenine-specific)
MEINKIYNEDCLIGMQRIPDKSIDAIICDLPFGVTACKWDSIIPFGPLWEQYNRIIRDNGIIALFGCEPFSTKVRVSAFDMYKYDWYWKKKKSNGFQHAKNRPLMAIETISIFSKAPMGHKSLLGDKRMAYEPQGIISKGKSVVKEGEHGRILGARPNQVGREYEAFANFPNNVLEYDNIWGKNAIHPTQKPVELIEYLIKTYTNEGETVLDNCMGSGTTAVAAINTSRNYIGFETDKTYYQIACDRIREALREPKLAI